MDTKAIYITIIIIGILFLLLDFSLTKIHLNIENYTNKELKENFSNNPPSSSNNMIDNDIFDSLNNKDLEIKDFYPNLKNTLPKKVLNEMIFKHKLFHQILPKFGNGYLGLVWHEPKSYGIYMSDSLKSNNWTLIKNSLPVKMKRPVFMTFDKDRKLLVIFEEKDSLNVNKYFLFKKKEVDLNSPFKLIDKFKVTSVIFDKDEILMGLDYKGNWYKKKSRDLNSEWVKIKLGFTNIPMRKLLFDYKTENMIGLGQDFRIYKKRNSDWLNDEWDTHNGPSKKTLGGTLKDLWYDFDGILMGVSRIGLVKQKNSYYLSGFKSFDKEILKKEVSIYKILYALTGIKTFGNESLNNNSNNVYIEAKRINEYKFKDPRLNKYLKHRMDMKKKCRKIKSIKISQEEENKEVVDDVRNDRFIRVLNEQKDVIDNMMDTINSLRNKE
tara:strand:+ start:1819 stop:3135 length:1317 start_codon:yes stop_codon:yes gene_type:complete